ncbi:MAG: EAL and HDOD domain-containing protein [Phycisphaerae bacterium]
MEIFVSRRPVFDARKDTLGYDLDFRSEFEEYYEALGEDKSSTEFMAFVNFGELVDGRRGYVSFSRSLLLDEFPLMLPQDTLAVGIPCQAETDPQLLRVCRELREDGYILGLDGFTPDCLDNPLLDIATFARVDYPSFQEDEHRRICEMLKKRNLRPIAMNVDNNPAFDTAIEMGYELFEGEFFSKPVETPDKDIAANKMTYLNLLKEINRPEISYDDITTLLKQDVALTYKLLRFMNSAWFGLKYEINSVKHALIMLGPREIRRWISVVVITNTGVDKPEELLLRSLTRARVAEVLAPHMRMDDLSSELFLLGMFSVIDALVDRPIDSVMEDIPLNKAIRDALVDGTGAFADVLKLIVAYEHGNWDEFSVAAKRLNLEEEKVPTAFRAGLQWGMQAMAQI